MDRPGGSRGCHSCTSLGPSWAFVPTFAFSIVGAIGGAEPQHANFRDARIARDLVGEGPADRPHPADHEMVCTPRWSPAPADFLPNRYRVTLWRGSGPADGPSESRAAPGHA